MITAGFKLPDEFEYRVLTDLIWRHSHKNGNRLALIANNAKSQEVRVTYAQLLHQAEQFANGLGRIGANKGDKVAIYADNRVGYEASVTLLACVRAGLIAVAVNARFEREEVEHAVNLSEARFLVFDASLTEKIGDISSTGAALETLIGIGGGDHAGHAIDWETVATRLDSDFEGWPTINESDVSEILFTSGSTARPKAAMLSSASGVYAALGFAEAIDLQKNDIFQSFFPFFTTACIRCVLFPAWAVGATAVLDAELDIQAIMDRIEKERSTVYVAVPAFYIFLLEAYDRIDHDLSSLRVVDAGGAALLPETTRQLIENFPWIDVRQTYGGTEGGPCGTVLRGDEALAKIGSAGRPWPHTELAIVDDDGCEVPAGELGEIILRSPGIFSGYFRNEEATQETLRGGWMYSGDLGRIDADGYLYVVDRKKDLVIRGGHNIGTLEVETVLLRHPKVNEVAVIGIPHEKLGEDLLAVVKCSVDTALSDEELREFCRGKLADYKTPRKFAFVEDFPRTGMGKILKRELRENFK